MGVMFLVGVPCLYCDVSDAWLLDRRWKRILVSAAGMLAELTLAAIAAVIWLFALDGPVRDVCVTVMVVCSSHDRVVQRKPAAAIRRLFHPRGPCRDSEPFG